MDGQESKQDIGSSGIQAWDADQGVTHPIAPGTGNPLGHGSSIPSLSHRWNH